MWDTTLTVQRDWYGDTQAGLRLASSGQTAEGGGMPRIKRILDIIFALMLLVPLSVVMLAVAAVLLVAQGRPLFYVAHRMRAPGQPFRLLKFRTMLREESDSGATGAHKPNVAKLSEYECGFPAFEDPRSQFDVRFYLVAILFIVFDLEAAFIYPWAVSVFHLGWTAWFAMMVFIAELALGLVYAWKKGALDWE